MLFKLCSYQTVLETHVVVGLLGDADGFLKSQVSLLTEGEPRLRYALNMHHKLTHYKPHITPCTSTNMASAAQNPNHKLFIKYDSWCADIFCHMLQHEIM